MAFQPKPGSGTLFKNDKEGNDKRPDYRGDLCLSTGEIIKLAGWIKEGAKGKFLSISIDKPRSAGGSDADFLGDVGGGGSSPVAGGGRDDPFADEVPFVTCNSIK